MGPHVARLDVAARRLRARASRHARRGQLRDDVRDRVELAERNERIPQLFGKFCNLFTLQAFLATHMQRLADHDLMDFVLFREPSKNRDIRLEVFSIQGRSRLGRQQQGIADGHADLFFTYVESHNTHIMNVLLSFWRLY